MPHIRARSRLFVLLAGVTAVAACSGGSKSAASPTAHPSSTASASDSAEPSPDISVGDVVFSSSLKAGTHDFGVSGANLHQDENGITLKVANGSGGYSFSAPVDLHGIPEDMSVHVTVEFTPPSKIYAGIACRGLDQNNTYLLLVDSQGDYAIVQVKAGNQTLLKSDNAAFDVSGPVELDVACVSKGASGNHLELAADGTTLASVDDDAGNVPVSNSIALFAVSPTAATGTGAVLFHDLTVRDATLQ